MIGDEKPGYVGRVDNHIVCFPISSHLNQIALGVILNVTSSDQDDQAKITYLPEPQNLMRDFLRSDFVERLSLDNKGG